MVRETEGSEETDELRVLRFVVGLEAGEEVVGCFATVGEEEVEVGMEEDGEKEGQQLWSVYVE